MSRKLRVLTRRCAIATLVVLMITTAEKAAADPIVLDQQHLPPPEGFGGPGSTSASITFPDFGFRRAQTFTVGREGRLVRVDVLLAGQNFDSVGLQILDTVGAVPTFTVLGGSHSGSMAADGWLTFDISARGLGVRPGKTLGIELVSRTFGTWLGHSPSAYPGGGDFFNNGEPFFLSNPDLDNFFRTYVDSGSPTPEPPVAILTLLGMVFLLANRRRFRSS